MSVLTRTSTYCDDETWDHLNRESGMVTEPGESSANGKAIYTVKPGRACGKDEGGVRDAQLPKLRLLPAIPDGNEPGEPDARKPARPVRERVAGNVSTSRVRERRVSFQSLSPALLETR